MERRKMLSERTGEEWLEYLREHEGAHNGTENTYPSMFVLTGGAEYHLTCVWQGAEHRNSVGARIYRAYFVRNVNEPHN